MKTILVTFTAVGLLLGTLPAEAAHRTMGGANGAGDVNGNADEIYMAGHHHRLHHRHHIRHVKHHRRHHHRHHAAMTEGGANGKGDVNGNADELPK